MANIDHDMQALQISGFAGVFLLVSPVNTTQVISCCFRISVAKINSEFIACYLTICFQLGLLSSALKYNPTCDS